MWSYSETDKGYIITRTQEEFSFSFQLSKRQEYDDNVIFWNKQMIKDLIDGLNDGSIPFHIDNEIIMNEEDTPGFGFSFTIPKTKIRFTDTVEHNNIRIL